MGVCASWNRVVFCLLVDPVSELVSSWGRPVMGRCARGRCDVGSLLDDWCRLDSILHFDFFDYHICLRIENGQRNIKTCCITTVACKFTYDDIWDNDGIAVVVL